MNREYFKIRIYLIVSLILVFFSAIKISQAEGGLSLSQTRVIFDEKAKSNKVIINNQSDQVYLINSRVLSSPDSHQESVENMPFLITPPLFRLEKESRNTVLISRNDTSSLPTDRESVFYLSFLAIPSVKKTSETEDDDDMTRTQVSFGIRTLIKLFYRPSGLDMPVSLAQKKLIFKQDLKQLEVTNPTPYYLTLAELTVNDQPINVRDQGAMLSPFSTQYYAVSEDSAKKISWMIINDFGGLSERLTWTQSVSQ